MMDSIVLKSLSKMQLTSLEELSKLTGLDIDIVLESLTRLQAIGLPIERSCNGRYRLTTLIQPVNAELIRQRVLLVDMEMADKVTLVESLDSTNSYLMGFPPGFSLHKQICIAEHMTAGRGRQHKQWLGGAYQNVILSVGWNFNLNIRRLSGLSLAVAVMAIRCLKRYGLVNCRLKWPNDILVDNCKLSGILVELKNSSAVVGIGINCSLSEIQRLRISQPVVCLEDLLIEPVNRTQLIADLLIEFSKGLELFGNQRLEPFMQEWMQLDAYRGVRVATMGNNSLEGIASGIDDTGALLVSTDNGSVQRVRSGEIRIVR